MKKKTLICLIFVLIQSCVGTENDTIAKKIKDLNKKVVACLKDVVYPNPPTIDSRKLVSECTANELEIKKNN